MNAKIKLFAQASVTALLGLTASISLSASAETVYYNGFEAMAIGQANDADVKFAWSTRYAKGPDEGRISITSDGYTGQGGRVKYPAGGNTTSHSGVHWETNINASAEALHMAYWIKLDADFQCVKGGKLPGLAGSESFPYGNNDWTARLMWREDCKLEWYLHDFALNTPQGTEPYRVLWDDFGQHAQLIPGQWHHIELSVKLNTPGQLDGRLQGWLDGVQVSDDWENSGIRAAGNQNVKINQLLFSTFFGGSSAPASQWQPTEDVYATFDEFYVSDSPIGMNPNYIDETNTGGTGEQNENPDPTCITYTGNKLNELELNSAHCVNVADGLNNKEISIADSDANTTCNIRGSANSANGNGSRVIDGNWEKISGGWTGNIINFDISNDCPYLKLRVRAL